MRAGIIAAGDGSRMAAGGLTTPKPLLRVGEMSLIERTMRALTHAGVNEIAFVVNERMTSVVEAVERLELGIPLHPVIATTPSSLHSLQALQPWLQGEPFVLTTVDSILHPADFVGFVKAFRGRAEVLLSYTDFVDDENPLHLAVDGDNRVTGLGPSAASSPFVTLGLYGLVPEVFPVVEQCVGAGVHRLRAFLGRLVREGWAVRGHRIGKGIDVDRPHDLAVAETFVREWELPS